MPRLVNEEIKDIKENVSKYNENLADAVYEHYKNIVVLSETINFKGAAADTVKNYMASVQSNIAEKIINVSDELLTAIVAVKDNFESFEGSGKGIVGDGTLKDVKKQTEDYKKLFAEATDGDSKILEEAAEFIATTKLNTENVINEFDNSAKKLQEYNDKLDEHDKTGLDKLVNVKERVSALAMQIDEVINNYRDTKGIIADKVENITKEPWYSNEMNGAFNSMAEEDPFYYAAGDASLYEDQWVTGMRDDLYIQAYARGIGATGVFKADNNSIEANGEFSAASGNVSTEFIFGNAEAKASLLDGEGHFNLSNKGLDAGAEAHLASVDGSFTIGNSDYNGFANGNASLGNADANIAFNNNEVALGAHASWARAEGDLGVTIGGVETSFGGSIGVQAGFGFSVSNTGFTIDGALIFGFSFSVKFP
ncbi:hypothetical protein AOC40_12795 [Listeria monocytogenes]|uniref:T7SS effector LXG polymorphic toxin n=1 Tax=Listeria monocytogenes TaxID=1639 RepID=UPI0008746346|nr:T7SS effector LXG polymorphic toxin [Listeria monocytogenes]EAC3820297.1 hypothetical protein [Listeria monocytogenes]EAD9125045.1 hypothetical protein [Listeria monocytogenes]EAE8881058.1 hypothetical protein [Listeria monocytogenes]EAE8893207.1 hypothetical protein [Listeria monocytogenes]EAF2180268.1 hypothetical protein [Listeria monocytogenes]